MIRRSKYPFLILSIIVPIFLFVWLFNYQKPEKSVILSDTVIGSLDPLRFTEKIEKSAPEVLDHINKLLLAPLNEDEVDPVMASHVDYLQERGILKKDLKMSDLNKEARKKLTFRDTTLTEEETKKAQICLKTGPKVYKKDYVKFFGNKTLHPIRRTHHTYLNRESLLVEFGGNWGWDAGNFTELYGSRHIIFEPLEEYYKMLLEKFKGYPEVSVYNLGVGAKNEKMTVALEGNNACSTSKFSKKNGTVPIYLINAIDMFSILGVGLFEVDLLAMNCEGCEYETLELLLKYNLIDKFRNIQWQTHPEIGISNPYGRYCVIDQLLSRTHRPTYRYKFNWESWRRKDLPF